MTDKELKLRCVEIALSAYPSDSGAPARYDILEDAKCLYDWITESSYITAKAVKEQINKYEQANGIQTD